MVSPESIVQTLVEILITIDASRDLLSFTPQAFLGGTIWNNIMTIIRSVTFPIGAAFFGCFLMMEIVNVWQRAGMDGMANTDMIIKTLIKAALFAYLFSHIVVLMNGLIDSSIDMLNKISFTADSTALAPFKMKDLKDYIASFGWWDRLVLYLNAFVVRIIVFIAMKVCQIMVIGRMFELYIMFAFAPIPMSTIPHAEMRGMALNFLKSFIAVCIQGAIMMLIICMFSYISGASSILGDMTIDTSSGNLNSLITVMHQSAVYSIALLMCLGSSGKIAKSLCGAM